jgi:hypothetical protein
MEEYMNTLRTNLETLQKRRLVVAKPVADGLGTLKESRTGIEEVQQRKIAKQKEQILKRYAKHKPAEFREYYISYNDPSVPEKASSRTTRELIKPLTVRVLIDDRMPKPFVVHQLLKIVDLIVCNPNNV